MNNVTASMWVRYLDPNNGYKITLKGTINVTVARYLNGERTVLGSSSLTGSPTLPLDLRARP